MLDVKLSIGLHNQVNLSTGRSNQHGCANRQVNVKLITIFFVVDNSIVEGWGI